VGDGGTVNKGYLSKHYGHPKVMQNKRLCRY